MDKRSRNESDFTRALNHFMDENELLMPYHFYSLSHLNAGQMEQFKEAWKKILPLRRARITHGLAELTELSFEVNFDPIFILLLGDEEPDVRAYAIDGLWENENVALIGPFVHLLQNDPDVGVRSRAALALGRYVMLGELEEIEPAPALFVEQVLYEAIYAEEESIEVCRRALESLSYSGNPAVRALIKEAYYSDEEKMRVSAIFSMGRSADMVWKKYVVRELESPNHEMRFEAARACGELEIKDAMPMLAAIIERDVDSEVRQAAIWALGRIGGGRALEILSLYCEDEDEAISLAANETIEEMGLFPSDIGLVDLEDLEGWEDWVDDDYQDFDGDVYPDDDWPDDTYLDDDWPDDTYLDDDY